MITGSMVALVTPMLEDGSIDWLTLDNLIEFHIGAGTAAIVAVGTTGESATLSVDEHCLVISRVVDQVAGRIPVIAGTGANSTAEAIELTRSAADVGADACLSVVPYYNKPTQEGLFRHFQAIAAAVDIPIILYNVPGRTACDMLTPTVERLSRIDNIIGIKEATGDVARASEIIAACGQEFAVYSGDDATAADLMLRGGKGTISVTANIVPAALAAVAQAALAEDEARCWAEDAKLAALHRALFVEANPIPVKWALCELGMIGPGIRLPLTTLDDRFHDSLRDILKQTGVPYAA